MSDQKTAQEILTFAANAPTTSEIILAPGQVVVVTGPNGVGKSAFLQAITSGSSANTETFFGSRQIHFSSEETLEIGQALSTFSSQLAGNVSRWRHPWGEQHLKSVIRRIVDLQAQTSQDIVATAQSGLSIEQAILRHPRPVEQLNEIFTAARLPIRFTMAQGRLEANREGSAFGIEKLSDGERAALMVVGAIIVRPPGSFILIDEPERHLNPNIAGPLIATAVRARPDIGYVFATHDLSLIECLRPEHVIHIQNSTVTGDWDHRTFEYSIIALEEGLPEPLRYAVLGSRKALLMVEGTNTSEDRALYGHLYPDWNVISREGWDTVVSGVSALNSNSDFHWLKVAGLIDGDGRSEEELATLADRNIFALPSPTIENIFLIKEVVEEMSKACASLQGGDSMQVRLSKVQSEILPLFVEEKDDMIARRVMWTANRILSEKKISVRDAASGQPQIEAIDLKVIREAVSQSFSAALNDGSVFELLRIMPVKNSKIPSKIAKCIGFDNFKKYAQAVLAQIETRSPYGVHILSQLRETLPKLPPL